MFLRTKSMDGILAVHRLFNGIVITAETIFNVGEFISLTNSGAKPEHTVVVLAVKTALVYGIAMHVIDKALLRVYNQYLDKEAAELAEILVNEHIVDDEKWDKLINNMDAARRKKG